MLQGFWYDLRFALRLLRRTPRNTAIAVAILSLGIGANTAMFSAVNHVLIRPLPFPDADQLVRLRDAITGADGQLHPFNMMSRSILAVRSATPVFDGVVAFSAENMTLRNDDVPKRLNIVLQSDGMSRTLKVQPAVGRAFSPDEERLGLESGVAIISDALWQSQFGGAPSALGSSLRLDNRTYTLIGVMPPQYAFPYEAQVWLPFALDVMDRSRDFAVFAHVRPGVTRSRVQDALRTLAVDIRRQYADTLASYSIQVMPIRESLIGTQDAPLRALTDVVAFLLLIACVNVATLLLARSVMRRREFALRAVLGATRVRHARQLLTESLTLGAIGCCAGLILDTWIIPLTSSLIPQVLSGQLGLTTPRMEWHVLMFAIAITLLSAIVAGIVPALGSWQRDPHLTSGWRRQDNERGSIRPSIARHPVLTIRTE